MKRLLLATVILTFGTSVFCVLHNSAARLRSEAATVREACVTHTQLLAQAQSRLTSIEERIRELQHTVGVQTPAALQPGSSSLFALAGAAHLSAEQSERLLADLGFDWNSTGDFLIVSKETLGTISLDGMRGFGLSDTACQVLAIKPDERAGIEAMTQKLCADYRAWAETRVQRSEPTGNIVAQYSLPADPTFTQSLSNSFAGNIAATLGNERGKMLLQYAYSWMAELGMCGDNDRSLTVKRYSDGDPTHLSFELKSSGNTMMTDVSPYQPFPEAFLPLFPNGWSDLAKREGFKLPKGF